MLKHTGSARDPFNLETSRVRSTQGSGLLIALLAIFLVAAAVGAAISWAPGATERVAGMLSSWG